MAKKKKKDEEKRKLPLQTVDFPLLQNYGQENQVQDFFPGFGEEGQSPEEESEHPPRVSTKVNGKEEPQTPPKEETEQVGQTPAEVIPQKIEKSLWSEFLLFAEESQKATKKKETQVWINEDLKIILERIRCAGVRLPIKHLMNGMLKAFLNANRKDIEKQLRQKIKL